MLRHSARDRKKNVVNSRIFRGFSTRCYSTLTLEMGFRKGRKKGRLLRRSERKPVLPSVRNTALITKFPLFVTALTFPAITVRLPNLHVARGNLHDVFGETSVAFCLQR